MELIKKIELDTNLLNFCSLRAKFLTVSLLRAATGIEVKLKTKKRVNWAAGYRLVTADGTAVLWCYVFTVYIRVINVQVINTVCLLFIV